MRTITLTLPGKLLKASSRIAKLRRLSRAERMTRSSLNVRGESMKVNAEFAAVEHAPDV